ncbi:MAG: branched-chain amino acid aminotransferase [Propionicimonas sp.]|nr:branched-chain amino acid aminotransferase [Propionicimonas sp.]
MTATRDAIFETRRSTTPAPAAARARILADPGFGIHFTDHMVTARWTADAGWHDAVVGPFGPLPILPGAAALQYAQQVFEGIKAYRHADGSVWTFRPDRNAARLRASAERFFLPAPDDTLFLNSLRALLAVDHDWVPEPEGEKSLYLRPYLIGTEQFLGVRPSPEVTYGVIASPSGAYVGGLAQPADVWLSEDVVRAAPGGTGEAKCGGNYAAGLGPYAEAKAHGCQQTLFLDAETRTWVEEFGGMNVMFVTSDNRLVTPALTGTILHGITRASLLQLAAEDFGLTAEERRVSIAEWRECVADGTFTEVFACGTAAVITPIGALKARGFDVPAARDTAGEVTRALRERLTDIQYGRVPDTRGWMVPLHD